MALWLKCLIMQLRVVYIPLLCLTQKKKMVALLFVLTKSRPTALCFFLNVVEISKSKFQKILVGVDLAASIH